MHTWSNRNWILLGSLCDVLPLETEAPNFEAPPFLRFFKQSSMIIATATTITGTNTPNILKMYNTHSMTQGERMQVNTLFISLHVSISRGPKRQGHGIEEPFG